VIVAISQRVRFTFIIITYLTSALFTFQAVVYSVTGPIILDLAELVNSDISKVSIVVPIRGLGLCIGSLLRGHLLDVSRCRTGSSLISFLICGGLAAAIPWSPNLEVMVVFFFLQGLLVGFIETGKRIFTLHGDANL
jgi:MFS family permease